MPPPPPPEGWQVSKPTSGKAIASLVCALGGLVLSGFCPIVFPAILVGLVLGILGIVESGREGKRSGRGLAIAGTVLSGLGIAGGVVAGVFVLRAIEEGGKELEREMQETVDDDVNLIAERMQRYCEQNNGTLHPGGPVLSRNRPVANEPAANQPDARRVTGALTVADLVDPEEINMGSISNYKLTITGPTTATLVITRWRDRREIEITDATKAQWVQRYP